MENKDITFVSYANPFSSHAAFPPMAPLEQYPYQQGQKATELLFRLLNKNKEERMTAEFNKIITEPALIINSRDWYHLLHWRNRLTVSGKSFRLTFTVIPCHDK